MYNRMQERARQQHFQLTSNRLDFSGIVDATGHDNLWITYYSHVEITICSGQVHNEIKYNIYEDNYAILAFFHNNVKSQQQQ